ncbi:uncharacterized protein LOC110230031 [Arabidopsis lyrata subsp. lyrata]|uniref:uncharacterized protein LOC110230031 n=1 Tax=Arabidopsis lyrata subsp. lyrata TaxID=81972 RepID=UPI000A29C27A|nr:uncharacterized protein LOC110230031 [Arabidopsis lyrata subsp. lyrata]|eukprot:XP_020887322.1 uncharacterized protein LOC110230031 [Arabidopsis lyrata subsp. lyrata]
MNPSLLVIDRPKIHEHPLTLLSREVSFICNACGTKGERSPYVCLLCCFMIHEDCIELPRVIRTNRHPHRLSHIFSFDSEKKLDCRICGEGIDGRYGAYSCLICSISYIVHSRCATRTDAWDGKELEGVPEEEALPEPYKVTGDERIIHFSHEEHELRRITNDYDDDDAHCYACNLHVYPDPFYKCGEVNCGFILHQTCANLPRETRIPIHPYPLTLLYKVDSSIFKCASCNHFSNGFRYSSSKYDFNVDTKCASITEPSLGGGHHHSLYSNSNYTSCCGCDQTEPTPLSCPDCELGLCYVCATLPSRIPYGDDAHPLSLNHGGRLSSQQNYWCDSCETQVDTLKKVYMCSTSCGTVVHTRCAIGGHLRNLKAGIGFNIDRYNCKVVLNDQVTRPCCSQCKLRSQGLLVLKICLAGVEAFISYFCSIECVQKHGHIDNIDIDPRQRPVINDTFYCSFPSDFEFYL